MPTLRARFGAPSARFAIWVTLVVLPACVFPTDESNRVSVRIDALSTNVVRGQTLVLRARATARVSGADLQPGEVTFDWSSGDESIATVTGGANGAATVTAVNTGRVTIRALARDYRSAEPGQVVIRVSNTVEIDSVVPDTVRYGEQVTLYGVGLGRISRVTLGETALIPDTASFAGDSLGEGSARYWVPYPARTGQVLAIASEGFSAPAAKQTVVVPANVYLSPDGSPAVIDLDGPPLASDGTLLYNPALALTPDADVNVFHLVRSDTTRPITVVVSTTDPVVKNIQPTISLPGDFSADPLDYFGWRIGTAQQLCKRELLTSAPDLDFGSKPATVIRSVQHTFRGGIDLRIAGESPGRYSLRIVDGYLAGDPRITPDRFEENDFCDGADVNFADPQTQISVAPPASEVLTIDQPYDVDWYRFTVPDTPENGQLVTLRIASLPFGAPDSSNLGMALLSLDSLDFAVEGWTAESHAAGSNERLSLELPPGDYYLLVADEVGVTTRYALCAAIGNDCSLPQSLRWSGSFNANPAPRPPRHSRRPRAARR